MVKNRIKNGCKKLRQEGKKPATGNQTQDLRYSSQALYHLIKCTLWLSIANKLYTKANSS